MAGRILALAQPGERRALELPPLLDLRLGGCQALVDLDRERARVGPCVRELSSQRADIDAAFLGGLRLGAGPCHAAGGSVGGELGVGARACMTIAGATDTLVFREYGQHMLCPSLRRDDVVILDNRVPHKSAETLALIEAAGASVRFLPAYSPDLNPIEKMWSKVKNSLRSAEARTLPDLERAIAAALQSVIAQDAEGWFQSCGYTQK